MEISAIANTFRILGFNLLFPSQNQNWGKLTISCIPQTFLQERTTELSSERIVEGCVGRLWQQCAPETQHSKECKVYRHCKRITLNTVNDRLAWNVREVVRLPSHDPPDCRWDIKIINYEFHASVQWRIVLKIVNIKLVNIHIYTHMLELYE